MKVLLYTNGNVERAEFLTDYIRTVKPGLMQDVILVDQTGSVEMREWANGQNDFTYVYFEEKITCGTAFNQVIEGLKIDDDILISECEYIPLKESYELLIEGLKENKDAFAIGPVSNSFLYEQHIDWDGAENALDWSEKEKAHEFEEMLSLCPGVILFGKSVVEFDKTFNPEAPDLENMILDKCIREFMAHGKMYICKASGFWDIRGVDYRKNTTINNEFVEKQFGIHYFNVDGNVSIVETIGECDIDRDEELKILEIGCDCGGTLFKIKKLFNNAQLYGTDINEAALEFASEFLKTSVNNIEEHNLDFGVSGFDIIIFGDVLEHLRDPLGVLLYCKEILKKGGRIVASIPNLMNIEVMKYLLDGYFPYAEVGLLDKTHIHMFTYNEIVRMFVNEAGYNIENITMNGELIGENERLVEELLKLGKAEKFMYQAFQYQVVAKLQ